MAKQRVPDRSQSSGSPQGPAPVARNPPLVEKRSSAIRPPRSAMPGREITGDEDTLAAGPNSAHKKDEPKKPPAPRNPNPQNDILKYLIGLMQNRPVSPNTLAAAMSNCDRVGKDLKQRLMKLPNAPELEVLKVRIEQKQKQGKPLKNIEEIILSYLRLKALIEDFKGSKEYERMKEIKEENPITPEPIVPEPIPLSRPGAPGAKKRSGFRQRTTEFFGSLLLPGKLSLIGAGVFSAAMHATGSFDDLRVGLEKALQDFDMKLTTPETMLSYYVLLGGVVLTTGAAWLIQTRKDRKRSALMNRLEAKHPNEYRYALHLLRKIAIATSSLPKEKQAEKQVEMLGENMVNNEMLFVSMETLLGSSVTDADGNQVNGATIAMSNAGLNIPTIRVLTFLLDRAELMIMGRKFKELVEDYWTPSSARIQKLREFFTDPKKPVFRKKMAELMEKDKTGTYVNAAKRQKYDKMNINGMYASNILQEIEGDFAAMIEGLGADYSSR